MEWHDFFPPETGAMTAEPQPEPLFLSFDDGPDPRYTESLLDLLATRHIRASFFVVARFAEQNPQIILRMKQDGHLIGLHSAEHISAYLMTPSYAAWDFQRSIEVLQGLGVRPAFYRPPWGHTTWLTRQLAGAGLLYFHTFILERSGLAASLLLLGFAANLALLSLLLLAIFLPDGILRIIGAIAALQAVLFLVVSLIPLPGGTGASEGGFLLLYTSVFTGGALETAMLLSRFASFYLPLLVSGLLLWAKSAGSPLHRIKE